MNYEKIAEFYSRAVSEKKFDQSLALEAKNISTEDDLKSFIEQKILPIAKSMGYDFSTDELISYEKHASQHSTSSETHGPQLLTEDDLEDVVGGVNVKAWALGGALSLTAILGTGIALNSNSASAVEAAPITESSITQTVQNTSDSTPDTALSNLINSAQKNTDTKTSNTANVNEEQSKSPIQKSNAMGEIFNVDTIKKAVTESIKNNQTQQSTNTQKNTTQETVKQTKTSISKSEQISAQNWMSHVDGNTSLKNINLPGTHDSATKTTSAGAMNTFASCQDDSIADQLNNGIRFLDLRVDYEKLTLCHGVTDCYKDPLNKLYLNDVFNDINNFLNKNSNETLIIRLKDEHNGGNAFNAKLNDFLKNQNKVYRGGKDLNSLTLNDVRGKIVIIADGLDNSFNVAKWSCSATMNDTTLGDAKIQQQDIYTDTTAEAKTNHIQEFYNQVWNNSSCDNSFHLCFTSCVGTSKVTTVIETVQKTVSKTVQTVVKAGAGIINGICKFFGAKKDVIETKTVLEKIEEKVEKKVNVPNPKGVAGEINKNLQNYIEKNHDKTFGIIAMDNPSSDLINSIIELNFNRV